MIKRTCLRYQLLLFTSLMVICITSFSAEVRQTNRPGQEDKLTRAIPLTPNIKQGKKIYPLCASCHMPDGWGKKDGSFPVIAGQHRYVLIKQLEDIRSKNRDNPTMYPFTEPGSIGGLQGIADVTAYIASLPVDPAPGVGSGKNLTLGKRIYQQHCQQCHGKNALGNNAKFFPRLKGQHYAYLLRQLKWIRNGYRKNANPAMIIELKTLSATEMKAVADYLSRR